MLCVVCCAHVCVCVGVGFVKGIGPNQPASHKEPTRTLMTCTAESDERVTVCAGSGPLNGCTCSAVYVAGRDQGNVLREGWKGGGA